MGLRDAVKAQQRQFTVHIDADGLLFATHLGMQETVGMGRHDLVPAGYIASSPMEMLKCGCVQYIDADGAYEVLKNKIDAIVAATEATETKLYFTVGKCFRYDLEGSTYKETRGRGKDGFTKPRPIRAVTKKWIEELALDGYRVVMCSEWEADDAVVLAKRENPDDIIAATDKDVINGVAGTHYNYAKQEFVEVGEFDAIYHPYKQAIMGDSSDGIVGIYGVGKVGAEKALEGCTTELELYNAVLAMYEKHGMGVEELQLTMRLLSMTQLVTEPDGTQTIKLYEAPKGE